MRHLYSALPFGAVNLSHRVVMAPPPLFHSDLPGGVPSWEMAALYRHWASRGGLIVTEEAAIAPRGGRSQEAPAPGIYSEAQVMAWRGITDAVHAQGGKIFQQLWRSRAHSDSALTRASPASIVAEYCRAARNAKAADFDGVEIQAARGILFNPLDPADTDERCSLLAAIAEALFGLWGKGRVGVRLEPRHMPGVPDCLIERLNALDRTYLHLVGFPGIDESALSTIRSRFRGRIILAGDFTPAQAERIVADGLADLIARGPSFSSRSDLLPLELPRAG